MALRDTWHKALVYFGLAEDHDYGPEYEEEFVPETDEDLDSGRDSGQVRRLPTSRRARRDEIDDIFADDEPIAASRTEGRAFSMILMSSRWPVSMCSAKVRSKSAPSS